jgi:hypothetical protein
MNTRSMIAAALALTLLTGGCQKKTAPTDEVAQTPPPAPTDGTVQLTPTQDDSAERTVAAQSRIADAFYLSIVPKLPDCWRRVAGKGTAQFEYTYGRDGDNWVFQQVELDGTTLDKGQDAAAMQCMQQAAGGSTFPVEPDEAARNAKEMVVHWGWPVPLPKDTTQLARMIVVDGGDTECPKLCQDCAWQPGRSFCAPACSGWIGCVEDGTGSGCKMTRPECKTGWSGPITAVVMAREAADAPVEQKGQAEP